MKTFLKVKDKSKNTIKEVLLTFFEKRNYYKLTKYQTIYSYEKKKLIFSIFINSVIHFVIFENRKPEI